MKSILKLKSDQDEICRKTFEFDIQITEMQQLTTKMEDLKQRVEENNYNTTNNYIGTRNSISKINDQMEIFRCDFRKEEEYMRVARKVTDNLQEEYCRTLHSIGSER